MLNFGKWVHSNRIILIILVFCVALVAIIFQPDRKVDGQDLPVVSLVSVGPSPVKEEGRLSITVGIDPAVASEGVQVRGGVIVWDSWKGEHADQLIAFVFREGDTEKNLSSQSVEDDGEITTDRTMRVAVN